MKGGTPERELPFEDQVRARWRRDPAWFRELVAEFEAWEKRGIKSGPGNPGVPALSHAALLAYWLEAKERGIKRAEFCAYWAKNGFTWADQRRGRGSRWQSATTIDDAIKQAYRMQRETPGFAAEVWAFLETLRDARG